MSKIALIHNKVRFYRKPLFDNLKEFMQVSFFIFDAPDFSLSGSHYLSVKSKTDLLKKLITSPFDVYLSPDLCFRETWIVFLVAILKRKPFLFWTETWEHEGKSHKLKNKIYDLFCKIIVKHSDAIIAPGEKTKSLMLKMGAKEEKIFIAPNACCLLREGSRQEFEALYGLSAARNSITVVFVGQIIERKGVDALLTSVKLLKENCSNFKFLIAGQGDIFEKQMRHFVHEHKLTNVHFLGQVGRENLGHLYDIADVVVTPSIWDPYPLVVIEALSCGKPVIVSDGVGEADDMIIDGYNGFVVPKRDAEAIAETIQKLMADHILYKRLSANALHTYKTRATYDHMVAAFRKAIEYAEENY